MTRRTASALVALALTFAPCSARADDRQRFLAEQRFETIRSFKVDMASTSPRGKLERTITYVAPDRMRIDMPALKLAIVTVGRRVWVRSADGKWHNETMAPGKDPTQILHGLTAVAQSVQGKRVTFVRDEPMGGVATHLYALAAPAKPGYTAIAERVWLGVRDGFPRRIVQHNGPYSLVATYSSFNAPLSVSGP